jgi:rhamnosyltransferase subunit B
MTQIILLTKGTGGDVFPFVAIGQVLQARGHVVTLVTHCFYEDLAQAAGLAFIPLDSFAEYHQMRQEDHQLLHPHSAVLFHRRHVLPRISNEYRLIKEHIRDRDALIVSHTNTLFTALIAGEGLQIPVILTLLSPYQIKMLSLFTGLLGVLADEFNHLRNSLALPSITNWSLWLRSFQSAIGNWPDWLASPEPDWPVGLSFVGFILEQTVPLKEDELSREARECWAAGKPCVLITHGTSLPLEPAFFEESIAACLQLGYNGLIVTPHLELTLRCPPQIRRFKSLPFVSILPHVQAIIHHGGIGTAAQALLAAKPQLIMGHGFDRVENAMLFQSLGVAKFLPRTEWKLAQIVATLQRLTTSPEVHKQCLEWAGRAAKENPLTMACNAIEATKTGPGFTGSTTSVVSESFSGSSYRMVEQPTILEGLSAERRELLALRLRQKKFGK